MRGNACAGADAEVDAEQRRRRDPGAASSTKSVLRNHTASMA